MGLTPDLHFWLIPHLTIHTENKLNLLGGTKNTHTLLLEFPNLPWALLFPKLQLSCPWAEPQSWPVTLKTEHSWLHLGWPVCSSPTKVHRNPAGTHAAWGGVGRPEAGLTKGRTHSERQSSTAQPVTPHRAHRDRSAHPAARPSPKAGIKADSLGPCVLLPRSPTLPSVSSHRVLLRLQPNRPEWLNVSVSEPVPGLETLQGHECPWTYLVLRNPILKTERLGTVVWSSE